MKIYKTADGREVSGESRPAGGWSRGELPLTYLRTVCDSCDACGVETLVPDVEPDGGSDEAHYCGECVEAGAS